MMHLHLVYLVLQKLPNPNSEGRKNFPVSRQQPKAKPMIEPLVNNYFCRTWVCNRA